MILWLYDSGAEEMQRNLFWLNDEQWRQIEPHLPMDVRGKDRVDDRRVISASSMFSRAAAGGAIARRNTARRRRSTIASYAGRSVAYGNGCSASLPNAADRQRCR